MPKNPLPLRNIVLHDSKIKIIKNDNENSILFDFKIFFFGIYTLTLKDQRYWAAVWSWLKVGADDKRSVKI